MRFCNMPVYTGRSWKTLKKLVDEIPYNNPGNFKNWLICL